MTYKIKKMVNNGTEYKIGSIDSSNDTYADIVHLTQAQYDALENPDPDTLYSTPDNVESGEFVPENEGTPGQVVTKTTTGYKWNDGIAYYTEAEYECLPDTKLTDGINYGIYDGDGTDNTLISLIKNGVSYCIPQGGTKYGYVDILLVGGGGGGGWSNTSQATGGGGGGGFVECISYPINSGTLQYGVTVGGGGQTQGGNSSALGLTAYGGAMGKSSSGGTSCGASGGGGAGGGYEPYTPGYGPSYQGQGCWGGNGAYCSSGSAHVGGGGGGAGSNGCNGIYNTQSGNGGAGKCSSISGELQRYSGGGGGGAESDSMAGLGGCGGGGNGGKRGCNGTYYGGGGGGNGYSTCYYSYGYQGIVIIRYKTDGSCGIKNTSAGGCKYTCGDYTIHCFTNTSLTECFIPVFK